MRKFFKPGECGDCAYELLRDGPGTDAVRARAWIDSLWEVGAAFVDPALPERAMSALRASFWELYVAATFVQWGWPVVSWGRRRAGADAPDLQIGDVSHWVEATAPSPGAGPDRAPAMPVGRFEAQPQEQVKFRIVQAMREKESQVERHVDRGVVRTNEALLVAINIDAIEWAKVTSDSWELIGSLFPFSNPTISIDDRTRQASRPYVSIVDSPRKLSGAQVSMDVFWTAECAWVSAVIFSGANAWSPRDRLGDDFLVVHNPHARTPVPLGSIPCWLEYWVEADALCWNAGVFAPRADRGCYPIARS